MPPIIQAENVTKIYRIGKVDVPALRGVSLAVERGELVSIVGPSGSGKSTLFYILGGLTGPTGGRVLVEGADFSRISDAERTRRVVAEAARRGLILLSCGTYGNVVRILVPLTAPDALVDEGLAILADSLAATR